MGNSPEFSKHGHDHERDIREISDYLIENPDIHELAFHELLNKDPQYWQLLGSIATRVSSDLETENAIVKAHFIFTLTVLKLTSPDDYNAFIEKITEQNITRMVDRSPMPDRSQIIDELRTLEIAELNEAFGDISPETAALLEELERD